MSFFDPIIPYASTISAIVAVISFAITISLAIITFRHTRNNNNCTHNHSSYSDLDKLYMDILKMGMENPKFRNPEYTCNYKWRFETEVERQRYECYAYMAWNVCETVHDRGEEDPGIALTWNPIVVAENKLHRVWFDNPENWHKFKKPYHDYVNNNEFEKPVVIKLNRHQKIKKSFNSLKFGRTIMVFLSTLF